MLLANPEFLKHKVKFNFQQWSSSEAFLCFNIWMSLFFTSTFFSPLSKVAFFNLLLFNSASKQKKCEIPVVVSFVLDAKISFRWNAWNMKMIKMRNNKKIDFFFFRPNNSTCSYESGSESWVWNDHSVSGHAKKTKTKSFAVALRM